MVKSRPYVILNAAISIDGKIATKTGDSAFSSKIDKIRVHELRSKVDAILVGKNTILKDDPLLTVRYVKGKNPIRIILDSMCTIPINSKIVRTSYNVPTIIAVSKKAPKKNLAKMARHPIRVISAGKTRVELKQLLPFLYKQKIKTLLLEGGGTTNWDFIRQGFVDEVIVTIAPYLVGGKNAKTLIEGDGFTKIIRSTKLKLEKITQQNNEVVLNYS